MPTRPPRRCLRCRTLFASSNCPTCVPSWGTSWAKGGDRRWRRVRAWWLSDHPLCVLCDALADTVDHIDGTDYATQRYDPAVLRSLCTSCHRQRTAQQGVEAKRRRRETPY